MEKESRITSIMATIRLLDEEERAAFWLSRADAIRPCRNAVRLLADELHASMTAEALEMPADAFRQISWHHVADALLSNPFEESKQESQGIYFIGMRA